MNRKCKFLIVLALIFMVATLQVQAEKYKGPIVKTKNSPKSSADCLPPGKNTELSLNLVRAYLKTNGTMWFREVAEYEVPRGSGKTSMFSAALWIGGVDIAGQLYVAAMRFGQVGNDYWTGPLQMKDGSINQPTCSKYDRFYQISRIEVQRHIEAFKNNDPGYVIPRSILEWPGNGGPGESMYLAPYQTFGSNDPTRYSPEDGDYPYYDFDNELCPWTLANIERAKIIPWLNDEGKPDRLFGTIENPAALPMPKERIWTRQNKEFGWDNMMIYADHVLKGDETIFWFLNDRGGPHTESRSDRSFGLEIRVQAFAFATNDELNKMTFYSYEIINRGSNTIYETFFSQWVDPDLGYADDDYVGCDVVRGMGYCYNGFEIDGTGQSWAYGANPPAVGVNFFQGPYIDADGTDNPKFYKDMADAHPNAPEAQREYCKRFVDYVVNLDPTDPNSYHIVPAWHPDSAAAGKVDTLRYNNQFAINGVNFGDGIIDNERFGMRRFVYHNNSPGDQGDPDNAIHYYNLLRGIWKNNQRMTYGGDGYEFPNNVQCDFMFPRGTDFCNWGTKGILPGESYGNGGRKGNWSEEVPKGVGSNPNPPADRRFMQSAGPFTLRQGACNYITVGIPWARATSGGVAASVTLLMVANDKCQALFENCFKVLDGPDAPNLTIREYDQKLILLLTNSPSSNNDLEGYKEIDPLIPEKRIDEIKTPMPHLSSGDTLVFKQSFDTVYYDRYYRFEGYQIYQVIGPEVGANDLENPSLARLVRQCDIKNGVGRLINWEYDEDMQVSVPREKVNGADAGIQNSFEITQDAFASGDNRLVNYKTYYFIAVAYAYNEYWPFSLDPLAANGLEGQKLPYLRGRKTAEGRSVTPIAAVPHPPHLHGGGLTLNSDYGSIPNITRVDGQGNGGIATELTQETIDYIVRGGDNGTYRARELHYEKNAGPLHVKVIDPLRVRPFDYTIVIKEPDSLMRLDGADVSDKAYWVLTIDATVSDNELKDAELVVDASLPRDQQVVIRTFGSDSTTKLALAGEHVILPLGISVSIRNVDFINMQPEVLKHWDYDLATGGNKSILGKYTSRNNLFQMPLPNAIYRAKYIYCHPEKIDVTDDIVFSNNGRPWITGLVDDNVNLPSNWIRAGSYNLGAWNGLSAARDVCRDYSLWRLEDAFHNTVEIVDWREDQSGGLVQRGTDRAFKDPSGKYGTLCGGTWAPYVLTTPFDNGPQAKYVVPEPRIVQTANGPEAREPLFWYYNFNRDGRNPIQMDVRQPGYNQTMTNLYSVNIVITPDKSLWTRAIVLESCPDSMKSEGRALKNEPRRGISRDKNGNKEYHARDGFGPEGNQGMSWFPGYAINIETGERLNIMFSENSDSTLNEKFGNLINGNDMWFNPTATYAIATKDTVIEIQTADGYSLPYPFTPGQVIPKVYYDFLYSTIDLGSGVLSDSIGIKRVWGGMHYVYVCNSAGNTSPMYYINPAMTYPPTFNHMLRHPRRNHNLADVIYTIPGINHRYGGFIDTLENGHVYPEFDCGPYDESRWLVQKFKQVLSSPNPLPDPLRPSYRANYKMQLFNNVMYTHIPMLPADPELQKLWMSSDVTYKIRVARPYMRYVSRWYETQEDRERGYKANEVPSDLNYGGFPVYKMSTRELAPTFNDTRVYQTILDNINIVPNPYYGGSLYERNALETQVKIINLPTDLKNDAPVTINIFTVSGILVRTLTKGDNETSYVNWDLKNYANIPIAGGVYIIHVNCPGIGERMLKFFCTMRPTDLNTF
ncbi:MAG: hypothetical protein FWC34_07410 [Bacteroidetes bacterium]|nr:hypothetical protein [Bacteroidota bacterium]